MYSIRVHFVKLGLLRRGERTVGVWQRQARSIGSDGDGPRLRHVSRDGVEAAPMGAHDASDER